MATFKIKHKGSLNKIGYFMYAPAKDRHEALRKAICRYGKDETIRKINFLRVVNKRRPSLRRIADADLKYVEKEKSKVRCRR